MDNSQERDRGLHPQAQQDDGTGHASGRSGEGAGSAMRQVMAEHERQQREEGPRPDGHGAEGH